MSEAPKATILLVEDDPDVRDALVVFLEKGGFDVCPATHGLDGLRKLMERDRPSAIVVDLMMPIMDGWDFLEKCPEGIPIVVLSGTGDAERTRAHPDVVAVLPKPVRVDALLGALRPYTG